MAVQKVNAELVELLSAFFPKRREPNFALGNVISTFQMLPGLRGLWPFSSVNESGNVIDLSGQDRTLTNNGPAPFGVAGLVPYASFNGTTQYFSRADEAGLNITGAVTWGGWFYFNALGSVNQEGVIGKHLSTGNQRAYEIYLNYSNSLTCSISADGAFGAGHSNEILSDPIATGKFYFLVGRFNPTVELALFVNGTKYTSAAGIVAGVFNSTAAFEIGRRNLAATYMNGRPGLCFLSAAAPSDAVIQNLYQSSKALFGL